MRFLTSNHYAKRRQDLDFWREALEEGLEAEGYSAENLSAEGTEGTNVVFRLGENRFVKVYAPFFGGRGSALVEPAALRLLTPHIPVPTVVAKGELEPENENWPWPFLILEAIAGAKLEAIWPALSEENRLEWCLKLGQLTKAMHRAGPGGDFPLAYSEAEPGGFRGFLYRRYEQTRRETSLRILASINEDLLDELARTWGVCLHADLELAHLFVADGEFSGLIDFGDSKVGDPVYDLVSLCRDVFQRRPERGEAFMKGYGEAPPEFFRRLGTYAFLHEWHDAEDRVKLAMDSGASDTESLGRWLWGY